MANIKGGASMLSWVTFDTQEIEQARLVIKQLEGDSTVDKLGLGNPVEKISDVLFPGTSTLHTSLRYNIFVPAIIASLYSRKRKVIHPADELRRAEFALQKILIDSGMRSGVIGRTRGEALKYWPSLTYWNGFNALQMFGPRYYSREEVFRIITDSHELVVVNDDGANESNDELRIEFDPAFLKIAKDLFKDDFAQTKFNPEMTFSLTKPEAKYLSNKYQDLHNQSLSSYLIQLDLEQLQAIKSFSGLPSTGREKLDKLVKESKIFSIVSAGITHAYRVILCDHLNSFISATQSSKSEAASTWATAKKRNLDHLRKWCEIKNLIPTKWGFKDLETAFKTFSDTSLNSDGLGLFVDNCLTALTQYSDPTQIASKLTNTIQSRENSIKKSRSHFRNPSIPIPNNVLGESDSTTIYMYDFRWWFGHTNATDIVEALSK